MNINRTRNFALATLCAATLAFSAGAAGAEEKRIAAGTLTCSVSPGVSFIFGSTRVVNCVYAGYDGKSQRYFGDISRFGVDIGFTNAATMLWTVVSTQAAFAPDTLTGTYIGVAGAATVGVGAAANVLIGGSNRSVSLQPVSIEGNTGLNLAFGVAELHLRRNR